MQPTEARGRDMRLVAIATAVTVGAILVAVAWTFWPGTGSTTAPSPSLPVTTSASTAGMGDLRAVDIISSATAGMGDLRAIEAPGSLALGIGDLRALEAVGSMATGMTQTIGIGDVRAEKLPSRLRMESYTGMGDLHLVE